MNVCLIIFLTLLIYSGIATVLFLLFDEKEDILFWFGAGIVGVSLVAILSIIRKSIKFFKYEFGKRTIFVESETGNEYKCKTKEREKYIFDIDGYKMVTKFAKKKEWKDIPDFPLEVRKRKIDNNLGDNEFE